MGVGVATNGQHRTLKPKILDPLEEHGEILDLYHHSKWRRFREISSAIDGQPHKAQAMVKYVKPTSGWTMLHQAAFWGAQDVAIDLLRLGADPDRKSKTGKSATDVTPHSRCSPINWAEAKRQAALPACP